MPIYEYRCEECGTRFEKLVRRAADSAEVMCPSCGEKRLTQQYSTFAAHSNAAAAKADAPVCPSGMCSNPRMCGLN